MDIHWALDERVAVLRPVGYMVGGTETDELVETGKRLVQQGHRALLVDLAEVVHVGSLGLGAFTRLVIACASVDGAIKICNLKSRVRDTFDLVRFNLLFDYHESEQAALESFARETGSTVPG